MARVLLVDDERKLAVLLAGELTDAGHSVLTAQDGRTAIQLVKEQAFDVVVTDIRMEEVDGLALLRAVKDTCPDTDVIMMTAYANIETTVEALRKGAADYLIKPFPPEELILAVERVAERQRLALENRQLKRELASGESEFIAASDAMKTVADLVSRIAKTDTSVLITGASGTGKEVVARAIHARSKRKDGPFVAVNCAALPEPLLESELFGHERGAFTGADRRKLGRFELADKGTLFLDEIGEIGQSIQVKLLRALETKTFERVGGTANISVDVRIIAATNKDLPTAIANKQFREDLYYRLNVFPISLPPLKERIADIRALAAHFVAPTGLKLCDATLRRLEEYEWPGNVRELRNVLERAVILCDGDTILPEHLSLDPVSRRTGNDSDVADLNLERRERKALEEALARAKGNKAEAARLLGISRRALYSRAASLGITLT
ncbi:MAG: Transcriptional regulatory protein ZraR [Candidatus Latescibacteria bacterium ADurb.Bin168]|nr:MAG: Transcriptional regulatory protein ZraR [Candidatus Latescibacteria bacterium ADurb.Bin168]